MNIEIIVAFVFATFLFGIAPGPGVIAVSAKSVKSGFRSSLILSLGILTGDLFYLLFALLGLSAIAQSMGELFVVIRYIGCFYLIYLGYKLWVEPFTIEEKIEEKKILSDYFSGLLISLGNPKVIIFYLGFLPTFWDLPNLTLNQCIFIVLTIMSVLSFVFILYSLLSIRGSKYLNEPVKRLIGRLLGSFLIFAGLKVAAE